MVKKRSHFIDFNDPKVVAKLHEQGGEFAPDLAMAAKRLKDLRETQSKGKQLPPNNGKFGGL